MVLSIVVGRAGPARSQPIDNAAATNATSEFGVGLGNPAAMARRSGARLWLTQTLAYQSLSWTHSDTTFSQGQSSAASQWLPSGGVVVPLSSWLIGLGVATTSHAQVKLPEPDITKPSALFDQTHPWRYSGLDSQWRRDQAWLALGRRLDDTIAVAVGFGISRISVAEHRRIVSSNDPTNDQDLALAGTTWNAPQARIGIDWMPTTLPIEVGAVLWWNKSAIVRDVTQGVSLAIPQQLGLALSVRRSWSKAALVFDADYLDDSTSLRSWNTRSSTSVDSRLSGRPHGNLRFGAELAVIPGLLWLSSSVGYHVGSTPRDSGSPLLLDSNAVMLTAGAQLSVDGVAVLFGGTSMIDAAIADQFTPDATVGSERTVFGLTIEYEVSP
jgi:hypothetical protein